MGEYISKKLILLAITLLFATVICGSVSAADADIQVNQTVNNSSPNLYDNVTFNTTVTNNGPDTATGVQVTNKLPSGVIYNDYTASQGTYNPTTGIWDVGTLTNGQIATLLLNCKVNQTGTIKDIANKTAETENDPNLDNNSQGTAINVPNAVDISVNQYLWYSSATYYYGNTPVFVVDVRNIGNIGDATNVIVRYTIADGFEYIATNTRGVGTATIDVTGKIITWTIPYMPRGAESTLGGVAFMNVYVRAISTGVKTPNLNNTAQLIAVDQYDYNSSNNQKSYAITVPTAHDIQVNQTYIRFIDGEGNPCVTYYITATNNGPDDAIGVTIKDFLPAGLEWVSNTQTTGTTYDKDTGIWTIGNFNYGDTPKTLNITAKIIATTGIIKNIAFLTAPLTPNFIDWNYDNNAQTTALVLSGSYTPNTNITVNQYLWYSSATYYYGNTPVFVVDVRNAGKTDEFDDATNVIVRYTIADGFEYIATNTRGVGTATIDVTGKIITWTIPYMPRGAESTLGGVAFMNVYVRAISTGEKTPNLNNTAELISPVYAVQPSKSYAITVPTAHDIQVNQTIIGSPTYNGTVTISITATNNGPDNATGVTIKDFLPAGLEWVSNTQTTDTTYNKDTGIWTIGNFNYGDAPKTLNITARLIGTGTIKNIAFLTAPLTPNFIDWNYDNNAQTRVIIVPDAADVGITQSINNTTPTVNDNITITLNATNYGPDLATNINVSDILPSGLQYVSHSTNYGTFLNGVWNIQNLLSGTTATLTIIAKAINVGNFTNFANLTNLTQNDWNTTNNQTNTSVAISGTINSTTSFTDPGAQGGTVNSDDGSTVAITLPFPITLYGHTYTIIYISVNGAIGLGNPIQGPMYTLLPENKNSSLVYIAPFWADFDVTYLGNVTYTINSTTVNITWDRVPGFTQNQNANRVNTVSLIMTSEGKFAFIYGDLNWKNDAGDYWTSYARIRYNSTTFKNFWTGTQSLSQIANKTIWFDSNGNLVNEDDPHIALNYTVTNSTPNYHDNVVYTIIATNQGPEDATGVKVTALLPSGLTFVSSSSTSYDSATGIWDIGSLADGDSVTLTITAYVNQTGTTTTFANVTAQDQYDPNPFESKNVTLTVPNAADIAVTMSSTDYTPTVGVNFDITIRVTNNGPNTATGVHVTDLFGATGPLEYRSTRFTSQGTYTSSNGDWNIGTLTSGQTATLTIRVRPRNGYQGQTVTNTATKTAETQYDQDTSNDSATITLNINP